MPKLSYPPYPYLEEVAQGHPECRRILDAMRVEGGRIRNLYRLLGWSPAVLRLWGVFARDLRDEVRIAPALKELMICRVVQLKNAGYALGQHRRLALAAGVSARQLDAVATWPDSGLFNATEQLMLRLADELASQGKALPGTLDALREALGERAVVEALVTGSFYLCASAVLNSLDPDPEDDAA